MDPITARDITTALERHHGIPFHVDTHAFFIALVYTDVPESDRFYETG